MPGITSQSPEAINKMRDIPVTIEARLDERLLDVEKLSSLALGSVLPLYKPAGETLEVYVENVRLASAEVVVIEDRLALRITAIGGIEA